MKLLLLILILATTGCAHRVDSQGNNYYYPPFIPHMGPGPLDCNKAYDCPESTGVAGISNGHGVVVNQVTINGQGYRVIRAAK
jgi:hypothetical protein